MSVRIDLALLAKHAACQEGVDWFRELFPEGITSFDDGLSTLKKQGRTDFMAWIFFHVPGLRAMAAHDLQAQVMGPRYRELGALVDGLSDVPWLRPGEDSPDSRLHALVVEHARRLAKLDIHLVPAGAPRLERVSMADAWAEAAPQLARVGAREGADGPPPLDWSLLWRVAYQAAAAVITPGAEAQQAEAALAQAIALWDQRAAGGGLDWVTRTADEELSGPGWFAARNELVDGLVQRLQAVAPVAKQTRQAAADAVFARCYSQSKRHFSTKRDNQTWIDAAQAMIRVTGEPNAAEEAVIFASSGVAAGARLDATLEALWLLADVQAPSPAQPLLDIWCTGFWPVGMIDNAFVVGDPRV